MQSRIVISNTAWILTFACASMFALGMADNIRGPLFPELIRFFTLDNTQASSTFAITSIFGFLGNLFAERILTKISISKLLVCSLLLMATALFLMGWVPTFPLYMASAGAFGLSMGLLAVAQNLIVAENSTGDYQTKALAGLHGLYGFSSLVAPFVASYTPVFYGDWRSGFFVTSATAFIVFTLTFWIRPKQAIPHVNLPMQKTDAVVTKISWLSLGMFGGILAFYVVAEILVSSRLALYMREYFNMDLKASSLYVTFFFTFMLIGRLAFTLIKFPFSVRKQLNILLVLMMMSLSLGLIFHPLFLSFTGLVMAPFYPLGIAYLSHETHLQKRRYITFAMALQNLCLISMHLGVGYLTDQFGLLYAFGVGFLSILLSVLCLNFHPRAPA